MSKNVVPIKILLVEDNAGDAVLIRAAFDNAKLANELIVAEDGEVAMDILNSSKEKPAELPRLILLDLNLPKKSGQEVLQELKADEVLRLIPVVIMTSSDREEDILKSYNLHVNAYITKPLDFGQLMKVVNSIEDFWFSVVRLPNTSRGK